MCVCVRARQIWEGIWFDYCKGRQCEPGGCQLANFSIYSQILIISTRLHEDKPLLVNVAGKLIQLEPKRNRSEEHTSELQSPCNLVCRLLLEKKKKNILKFTKIDLLILLPYPPVRLSSY